MLLGAMLTSTRFPSWCNVFDDNVVVLDGNYLMKANTHYLLLTVQCFKNEKLTSARFSSWCIVIDDDVGVLYGKLHYERLHTL